jgi:UDP-N-acetylglucosamine acyltransferase
VPQIHASAVVDPRAELAEGVIVGPFCIVEAGAIIGPGTRLEARTIVKARTTIGAENEIGEGTVIGGKAQHAHETNPGGSLVLGDHNRIRENVTIHRGWTNDGVTRIGDGNLIMVAAHIGHDCRIGNNCIIVNNVMLGGHAQIDDRAYLGGGAAVHQFGRVGRLAMVGGMARCTQDVPPFVMIDGGATEVVGLNKVGLRRNGYTPEQVQQLKDAYRIIYRQGLRWSEVLAILKADFNSGPAAAFYDFLKVGKRGFVQERRISRKATLKIATQDDVDFESRREAA